MFGADAEMMLVYTLGGFFLLFVIVMAFGAHVLPTGPMIRNPTRKGDIIIGILGVCAVVGILYAASGAWKHMFGMAPPPVDDKPMLAVVAMENMSTIGYIAPEALQKPKQIKREAREYCEKLQQANPQLPKCVLMLWADPNYLPRRFPIHPISLAAMTANYARTADGKLDRFCWLKDGKPLEDRCF